MATYQELRGLFNSSDLLIERIEVALIIAANNLARGPSTTEDRIWVAEVYNNPRSEAQKALMALLAQNSSATTAQIKGVSDDMIQIGVDDIVPILVAAKSGI